MHFYQILHRIHLINVVFILKLQFIIIIFAKDLKFHWLTATNLYGLKLTASIYLIVDYVEFKYEINSY